MSARARLVDAGYAAGWRVVRTLPEPLARGAFRLGADLAVRRGGAGARQLRRNLARVRPDASPAELDHLLRCGLRSYARYWCEAFRLPAMDLRAVHRRLDASVAGREHLDAALAAGRGVIAVLPHTGNWDMAGVWLAHQYGRFTTVAERLRPESLFRRFVAYRESLGFEVVPLTGGDRSVAATLVRRLRENRVVCLVADRDLTTSGVPVTFFGEPTRMPAGPASLAATTGAALLPVRSHYTDAGGWEFLIYPPVPVDGRRSVPAATQAMADVFAADIAERPEDWHMLQPFWPADLPAARRAELAPEGAVTTEGAR
ncbi:lipid A biosynthesis lauroyl acyltransferase [Longimycelium tulufanense]|uniref:Lipid A biosynthesis lauroyl acyltransferase n=1 Tax=Longimycelium tulufanense TaxID=907463 RepID=A0A8J3CC17_9PSEU|nr:phosphatidylinositol mannoside acyltransferase [Longimycelium tulufanense]GGM72166.1 lipid A biosynthesis lauroyl acyltransferase [Longimycelium tulufanense]